MVCAVDGMVCTVDGVVVVVTDDCVVSCVDEVVGVGWNVHPHSINGKRSNAMIFFTSITSYSS